MTPVSLTEITGFLDEYLDIAGVPDYPNALNGLQVEGRGRVERLAVAVDASAAVIDAANDWADLLIVHHGLFWNGLQPLTGPHYRRVKALIEGGTSLYSVHLPLDAHAEVGNSAILARELGLTSLEPFGDYRGTPIGWCGVIGEGGPGGMPVCQLADALAAALGCGVQVLPGGPDPATCVGVVTGAGASLLSEAAAAGIDVLVTGEAQHHHAIEAAETGVTLLLGGHYATEVWGVKAVSRLIEDRFGIESRFIDSPTGL